MSTTATITHPLEVPDIEAHSAADPDPYSLRSKLQDDGAISALRKRGGGGKRLGAYYSDQNSEIEALLKPLDQHVEDARVEGEANRLPVRGAVRPTPGLTR